jgi:hypothetical protein
MVVAQTRVVRRNQTMNVSQGKDYGRKRESPIALRILLQSTERDKVAFNRGVGDCS